MKPYLFLLFLLPNFLYSNTYFKYEVNRYDTFDSVATKFRLSVEDVITKNKLEKVDYLLIGQQLDILVNYTYREPEISSLYTIMNKPMTSWKNPTFDVYKWDKRPNVLIFDTINYSFQSLMFKRLAFFVEKKEYAGTIYTLEELKNERGWNGHDYKSTDLARFFNEVNQSGLDITKGEEILLEYLLKNRLIEYTDIGYVGLGGAVISCSRSSLYNPRYTILWHEALHGLFFTSAEFRSYTKDVWNSLDRNSKGVWLLYLDYLKYDTSDEELVYNEFMAYILQLDQDETYRYFRNIVFYRLYFEYPKQREMINAFFSNNRTPYKDSIDRLDSYAKKLLFDED